MPAAATAKPKKFKATSGGTGKSGFTKVTLFVAGKKAGRYGTDWSTPTTVGKWIDDLFADQRYDGVELQYVIEAESINEDEFSEAYKAA